MTNFQITALDPVQFNQLFDQPDDLLARQHIQRMRVSDDAGVPCRVSLDDARPGDDVLLLHYRHHDAPSPYQASGPIFVRRQPVRTTVAPGVLPTYVTRRLLSVRAYGADHGMVDADVCEGALVAERLHALMARDAVAYVHLHVARQGCFLCAVARVSG